MYHTYPNVSELVFMPASELLIVWGIKGNSEI